MGLLTPEIRKRIVKAYKKGYRFKTSQKSSMLADGWYGNGGNEHTTQEKTVTEVARRPLKVHSKVTGEIENAIIVLRDSFNWGTHRISLNLRCPPGYIHNLLTTITGRDWQIVKLSRQTVYDILKKHRRNGSPYKRNKKDWKYFCARKPNGLW